LALGLNRIKHCLGVLGQGFSLEGGAELMHWSVWSSHSLDTHVGDEVSMSRKRQAISLSSLPSKKAFNPLPPSELMNTRPIPTPIHSTRLRGILLAIPGQGNLPFPVYSDCDGFQERQTEEEASKGILKGEGVPAIF